MNITIEEYRARLYAALAGFDQNEVAQAVNYYIELIEDADDPAQQMAKLGTPEQLAQRIIADNGWSNTQYAGGFYGGQPMSGITEEDYRRSTTSGLAKRVLALILTFPFWLTAFILIITLLIVVWSVFIAFPAGAVAAIIESFRWIGKYFGYALPLIFAGVGLAGLTIILFAPVRAASKGILKGVSGFAKFLFGIKPKKASELKEAKSHFSKGALILGGLLFVLGGGISAPLFAKAANSPEKFSQALGLDTCEYDISDSNDIKVDINGGASLYICPSDSGRAYLKGENIKKDSIDLLEGNACGFNYNSDGNTDFHFFNIGNIGNTQSKFYLYLPEKEYDSADVKLSLGDVKIERFTAKNFNIENNCGDIKLTDVKQSGSSGSFTIKSDLGDIKLENCNAESGSAQLTQHCGSIKLEKGSVSYLRADNDLGDIKLESISAKALDFTNHCGDIKLTDTSVTDSITCKLDLGDAKFELKGKDYNVSAKTDRGDVKINGNETNDSAGGSIPVTITNNTGDIKVDFN